MLDLHLHIFWMLNNPFLKYDRDNFSVKYFQLSKLKQPY